MNWKSILYKGLPVLLIAIAIVVVAVIVSRPDPQPQVSNADKVILEYKDLKVTKGELYDLLKRSTDFDTQKNTALTTLLNMIDMDLLENELETYEINEDDLNQKIEDDKEKHGEELFYEKMILLGIIESKDDENINEKLEEYYKLVLLKDIYAKELATKDVEEDEEAFEKALEDYKEMACGIILRYEVERTAKDIETQIAASDDVLQFFKDEWEKQQEDEEDEEEDDEEDEEEEYPEFIKEFKCDYDKIEYKALKGDLRNFVYGDTFLDENNNFIVGTYNTIKKLVPNEAIYFVYILGVPTYDLEEGETNFRESNKFKDYIKEELINKKFTDSYKNEKMEELRKDTNLKIYDKTIGNYYKDYYDTKFKVEEKLLKSNKNVIASYKVGGKTIYITADDLYKVMKERYGMYVLIEKINYEALKTVKGIELTKEDEKAIRDEIANLKTFYLANYSQIYTWSEFLNYHFKVANEDEFLNRLAADKLLERYQFGHKDYKGIVEELITEEDLQEAYDKWFSIKASHILFEYDPEVDGDEELARAKADQILYGCTDDGVYRENITEETCYIFYDVNPPEDEEENEEDVKVPFVGLDETPVSKWANVFSDLAKEYSTEPAAKTSGGNLNFFGPGKMVKEFEDAAKEIASRMEEYPFSYEPVATEIERDDETIYGIHVIYVTGKKEKPEQPDEEQYQEYLEDLENEDLDKEDLEEKYGDDLKSLEEYRIFMEERENELRKEYKTDEYKNKLLADLRISQYSKIKIHDDKLENILKKIDEFYKLEVEEEEETEE